MTYFNTSLFTLPLITLLVSRTWSLWRSNKLRRVDSFRSLLRYLDSEDSKADERTILRSGSFDDEARDGDDFEAARYPLTREDAENEKLGLKATAKLSFQFCLIWVWLQGSFDTKEFMLT